MTIQASNVTKHFGKFAALNDISITVREGELLALLGPSGSGKTTLLRAIAGLETIDRGEISFFETNVTNQRPADRKVGFVFQHYALFRHMTVFENVAFGLRVRPWRSRPAKAEIKKKVRALLELIQLGSFENRYPWQLSGGQRQRVALARALAVEPRILLLDEPFGALDAKVRQELRRWLRRLHDDLHVTSVFVTHDQEEALEVADRIVVMNGGRIEQIGTPEEVFHRPASEFVMRFLGNVNFFHGRVENGVGHFGPVQLEHPDIRSRDAADATLFVRPHEFSFSRTPLSARSFKATIRRIVSAGPLVRLDLTETHGHPILAEIPHEKFEELQLKVEEEVFLTAKDTRVFLAA